MLSLLPTVPCWLHSKQTYPDSDDENDNKTHIKSKSEFCHVWLWHLAIMANIYLEFCFIGRCTPTPPVLLSSQSYNITLRYITT